VSLNLLWFLSPVFSVFCLPPLFCVASSPIFCVLCGFFMSLCVFQLNLFFFLFYILALLHQMERRKFSSLFCIPFLSRYCRPCKRQETCGFKDLYFWRNFRKSNLLSNDIDLVIFRPRRLEIQAITRDSIWSTGSSGLIQSLLFDSLFGLQNNQN